MAKEFKTLTQPSDHCHKICQCYNTNMICYCNICNLNRPHINSYYIFELIISAKQQVHVGAVPKCLPHRVQPILGIPPEDWCVRQFQPGLKLIQALYRCTGLIKSIQRNLGCQPKHPLSAHAFRILCLTSKNKCCRPLSLEKTSTYHIFYENKLLLQVSVAISEEDQNIVIKHKQRYQH